MVLRGHEQCLPLNHNSRLGKDTKLDGRTAVLGSFSTKGAHYSPFRKDRCGRMGSWNDKQCWFTGYMGPWFSDRPGPAPSSRWTQQGVPNNNLLLGCPSGYQILGNDPRQTYDVYPDEDWGVSWDEGREETIPSDLHDGLHALPQTSKLPGSRTSGELEIAASGEYPEQFKVKMDDAASRELMAKTDGPSGFFGEWAEWPTWLEREDIPAVYPGGHSAVEGDGGRVGAETRLRIPCYMEPWSRQDGPGFGQRAKDPLGPNDFLEDGEHVAWGQDWLGEHRRNGDDGEERCAEQAYVPVCFKEQTLYNDTDPRYPGPPTTTTSDGAPEGGAGPFLKQYGRSQEFRYEVVAGAEELRTAIVNNVRDNSVSDAVSWEEVEKAYPFRKNQEWKYKAGATSCTSCASGGPPTYLELDGTDTTRVNQIPRNRGGGFGTPTSPVPTPEKDDYHVYGVVPKKNVHNAYYKKYPVNREKSIENSSDIKTWNGGGVDGIEHKFLCCGFHNGHGGLNADIENRQLGNVDGNLTRGGAPAAEGSNFHVPKEACGGRREEGLEDWDDDPDKMYCSGATSGSNKITENFSSECRELLTMWCGGDPSYGWETWEEQTGENEKDFRVREDPYATNFSSKVCRKQLVLDRTDDANADWMALRNITKLKNTAYGGNTVIWGREVRDDEDITEFDKGKLDFLDESPLGVSKFEKKNTIVAKQDSIISLKDDDFYKISSRLCTPNLYNISDADCVNRFAGKEGVDDAEKLCNDLQSLRNKCMDICTFQTYLNKKRDGTSGSPDGPSDPDSLGGPCNNTLTKYCSSIENGIYYDADGQPLPILKGEGNGLHKAALNKKKLENSDICSCHWSENSWTDIIPESALNEAGSAQMRRCTGVTLDADGNIMPDRRRGGEIDLDVEQCKDSLYNSGLNELVRESDDSVSAGTPQEWGPGSVAGRRGCPSATSITQICAQFGRIDMDTLGGATDITQTISQTMNCESGVSWTR